MCLWTLVMARDQQASLHSLAWLSPPHLVSVGVLDAVAGHGPLAVDVLRRETVDEIPGHQRNDEEQGEEADDAPVRAVAVGLSAAATRALLRIQGNGMLAVPAGHVAGGRHR